MLGCLAYEFASVTLGARPEYDYLRARVLAKDGNVPLKEDHGA